MERRLLQQNDTMSLQQRSGMGKGRGVTDDEDTAYLDGPRLCTVLEFGVTSSSVDGPQAIYPWVGGCREYVALVDGGVIL